MMKFTSGLRLVVAMRLLTVKSQSSGLTHVIIVDDDACCRVVVCCVLALYTTQVRLVASSKNPFSSSLDISLGLLLPLYLYLKLSFPASIIMTRRLTLCVFILHSRAQMSVVMGRYSTIDTQ